MKKALLPLLLLPVLLASCNTGISDPVATPGLIIFDKTVELSAGSTYLDASTSITRINAYDPITFSTSPLPTGITLDFKKNPVTDSGPAVFNVGALTAAPGTYTTTLKGVSGELMASAKLTIIVSPRLPHDGPYQDPPSPVR